MCYVSTVRHVSQYPLSETWVTPPHVSAWEEQLWKPESNLRSHVISCHVTGRVMCTLSERTRATSEGATSLSLPVNGPGSHDSKSQRSLLLCIWGILLHFLSPKKQVIMTMCGRELVPPDGLSNLILPSCHNMQSKRHRGYGAEETHRLTSAGAGEGGAGEKRRGRKRLARVWSVSLIFIGTCWHAGTRPDFT